MKVQIRIMQSGSDFQVAMEKDGWDLCVEPDGSVVAEHPAVVSEPGARARLHRLGLLTSRELSIRFSGHSAGFGENRERPPSRRARLLQIHRVFE
jgi:hypothetical protein